MGTFGKDALSTKSVRDRRYRCGQCGCRRGSTKGMHRSLDVPGCPERPRVAPPRIRCPRMFRVRRRRARPRFSPLGWKHPSSWSEAQHGRNGTSRIPSSPRLAIGVELSPLAAGLASGLLSSWTCTMIFSDHDFNYLHCSNEGIDQNKKCKMSPLAAAQDAPTLVPSACRGLPSVVFRKPNIQDVPLHFQQTRLSSVRESRPVI